MDDYRDDVDRMYGYQDEDLEFIQRLRIERLEEMLTEIESQLEDRGGFDILRGSINNTLNK